MDLYIRLCMEISDLNQSNISKMCFIILSRFVLTQGCVWWVLVIFVGTCEATTEVTVVLNAGHMGSMSSYHVNKNVWLDADMLERNPSLSVFFHKKLCLFVGIGRYG